MSRRAETVLRAFGPEELTDVLQESLGGGQATALWVDGGARVLVHAARAEAEVRDHGVVVRVPLEADEGAGQVGVSLALAGAHEPPDLVAAADERADGDPALAGRWGPVLQEAVFAVLVDLLDDAARGGEADALGVRVRDGAVELVVAGAAER